ncbi:hypothetical protein Taro_004987 [Colocasia esculenta]|uniref:Uncharacterized protein n=1 Tax=Colocasia esculenta TaxID=4460 RepID=A0A843TJP8_COLES|nr:hypothetical protein [Colocasia esculenta]
MHRSLAENDAAATAGGVVDDAGAKRCSAGKGTRDERPDGERFLRESRKGASGAKSSRLDRIITRARQPSPAARVKKGTGTKGMHWSLAENDAAATAGGAVDDAGAERCSAGKGTRDERSDGERFLRASGKGASGFYRTEV